MDNNIFLIIIGSILFLSFIINAITYFINHRTKTIIINGKEYKTRKYKMYYDDLFDLAEIKLKEKQKYQVLMNDYNDEIIIRNGANFNISFSEVEEETTF